MHGMDPAKEEVESMDIPRPSQANAERRKRILIGSAVVVIFAAITFGLSRLEAAVPTVDSSVVWIDTAVARALGGHPVVLLADEPTGNLDSKNDEAVMDLLHLLHPSSATIPMVTRDTRFARHADRTVHLFDGRIVDDQVAAP